MASDHAPRRVVALQPSATVILHSLRQFDRLVACTKYCADVCPEVLAGGRTIIADSWTARAEEIIAAQPDLVIAAVPYQEKAVVEILRSGARFLGLAPKTLADIYTDIAVIAGVMGVPERSRDVIRNMTEAIEAIRKKSCGANRPRVFCEEWGKPLFSSQRWVAELVEAAGGEMIGTPGAQILPEQIRDENPDVLIAAWCGAGERVPLGKIVRDRGWSEMRAVKESRVYCIRDEFLNTPAPTLLLGLHALAAAIHPERFPHTAGLRCVAGPPDPRIGAESHL